MQTEGLLFVCLVSLCLVQPLAYAADVAAAGDVHIDKQTPTNKPKTADVAVADTNQAGAVKGKENIVPVPAAAPADDKASNAAADNKVTADKVNTVNQNIRHKISDADDEELPNSIRFGFYMVVGFGFLAAAYISYRAFRWVCI